MAGSQEFLIVISVGIGYLFGSISPAYIFGRLHHVDIRQVGNRNAGTTNVYRVLGLPYAVITAIYDAFKGLLAIVVATRLGVGIFFAEMAGLAAVAGHVLPFYLKFRGGQGMATAMGLFIYAIIKYLLAGLQILFIFLYVVAIACVFLCITRIGEIMSMLLFPLLGYAAITSYPGNPGNIFFSVLVCWMAAAGFWNCWKLKRITIQDETFKAHKWRVITRPFAVLFPIFQVVFSRIVALFVIGLVAMCFILVDLIRLLHRRTGEYFETHARSVFRLGEKNRFSSMTVFLVAAFTSVLLFEQSIAVTALIFLIFGDFFGKIFGMAFGRHKLFHKTLEGLLANYGSVLIFGYVIFTVLPISLPVLLVGGAVAPIVEVLSQGIDDNFSVPIISGTLMTVITFLVV